MTLGHCKNCGILKIKNNTAEITLLGQKLLDANKERYFEISEAQKQVIAERIIFRGAWSHFAREIFDHFSVNQITATYELSTVDVSLSTNENTIIHFFKFLGILHEDKYVIKVDRRYTELVYQLTADRKAITEQQLEKILMENRKLGAQAENAVVEFEKQRLNKMGKFVQAELVKRISTINVSAGYDVESFDGDNNDIFPNRFIEVKATIGDQIRFYWSNNELKVAKEKKDVYWIYMMKDFKEDRPQEAVPIMIQNPEHNITKSSYLTIDAHHFLIKEIAEVIMTEHALEELKWYQLV